MRDGPAQDKATSHDFSASRGFGKRYHLTRPRQFTHVLGQSRKGRSQLFRYGIAANRLPYPRLGITVSKKVSPSAVRRNRIKRLVREHFRNHKQVLCGFDIVLTALPATAHTSNLEINQDLDRLWDRFDRHKSES